MELLADNLDFDDNYKSYSNQWKNFCKPFIDKVKSIVEVKTDSHGKTPQFCPWCGSKIGHPWPKFCFECGNLLEGFNVDIKEKE